MPWGNICSRSTNYVGKFGPRRETIKEIIEADPMKEVLHLRAIFGPRRETMKEIIEADTDPMKEVLCLGATFAPTQQIMMSNLVQGGKL